MVVRLYPVWFSCSVAQSVNPLSWVRLPDAVAVAGVADGGDGGGGDDGGADDGGGGDDGGDGGGGVGGVATCKDELIHGTYSKVHKEGG